MLNNALYLNYCIDNIPIRSNLNIFYHNSSFVFIVLKCHGPTAEIIMYPSVTLTPM